MVVCAIERAGERGRCQTCHTVIDNLFKDVETVLDLMRLQRTNPG